MQTGFYLKALNAATPDDSSRFGVEGENVTPKPGFFLPPKPRDSSHILKSRNTPSLREIRLGHLFVRRRHKWHRIRRRATLRNVPLPSCWIADWSAVGRKASPQAALRIEGPAVIPVFGSTPQLARPRALPSLQTEPPG